MADIELVIKIDEEEYNNIKGIRYYIPEKIRSGKQLTAICLNAIANGTPLPKGHGRLIDADELVKEADEFELVDDVYMLIHEADIYNASTIIEADRSEE